jgi:hypothetical protein
VTNKILFGGYRYFVFVEDTRTQPDKDPNPIGESTMLGIPEATAQPVIDAAGLRGVGAQELRHDFITRLRRMLRGADR